MRADADAILLLVARPLDAGNNDDEEESPNARNHPYFRR
jgi:hypothetical protein